MSAFKCVLQEWIKSKNCLMSFRALKAHSTSSSSSAKESSHLVKSTGTHPRPDDTVASIGHEADKFRGGIGRKNKEGRSDLDLEVDKFIAALHKADHDLTEFAESEYKALRKSMVWLGIVSMAYCAAIYAAFGIRGSSKEVADEPSPQQVPMDGNPMSACGSG